MKRLNIGHVEEKPLELMHKMGVREEHFPLTKM